MAKYIDAAAFAGKTLTSSESQLRFREMTGTEAYYEFLRLANEMPTADVAPVRRGEWIEPDEEESDWRCSICGGYVCICVCGKDRTKRMPFCPNCGARMDLGGDGNA